MNPATPGSVLVTGGSGYIAGFCIAQLLQEGWRVRTTVRDLAKAERLRENVARINGGAPSIEIFRADLCSDEGWKEAVAGADYVLHVASPTTATGPKSDDELVTPARDGVLRVLNAARDAGVKRVVMTSSICAIAFGRGGRAEPFTELDWTDETNRADSSAYDRSKTIAERAAWAWHAEAGGALELVAVNPGFVIGPVLGQDFSPSIEVIKKLLDGSVPALPRLGFALVDVRDVARLHYLAMITPGAAGHRFIGSGDFFWVSEIAAVLERELGPAGRKVPSIAVPDFLVRIFAIFDPVLRSRVFDLGKKRSVSSQKAREMLGWSPRAVEGSIIETARTLQSRGLV